MPPDSSRPTIGRDDRFRTGDWIVDPSRNLLRAGDEEQRLGNRVMSLLVCLAAARGQVLLKEEILEDVWEGRIVSDDALTVAVYNLRKALGDSADESFYIETIPGRGYRWRAPVEPVGNGASAQSQREADITPRADGPRIDAPSQRVGRRGSGPGRWLVAGLLLGAVLPIVFFSWFQESSPAELPNVRTVAVLSLTSASKPGVDDESEARFARGVTEMLTTALERGLPALAIEPLDSPVDRSSSVPTASLPRDWKADLVVAGSVDRSSSGRVRLTAELLVPRELERIGGAVAEGDDRELPSLVASLVRDLSSELSRAGFPVELRLSAAMTRTADPGALDSYFRALDLSGDVRPEALALARDQALTALELDPTLVEAHVLLVELAQQRVWWGLVPVESERSLARRSAASAQALDPGSPHSLTAAARAKALDWNLEAAEELLQQAIRISPSLEDPHSFYSIVLVGQGRLVEAIARSKEAMDLRPRDPGRRLNHAWILINSGRGEDALEMVAEAESLGALSWEAELHRSHALHALGQDLDGCRSHLLSLRLRSGDEVADGLLAALEQGGTAAYYEAFLEWIGVALPPVDRIRNLLRAGDEAQARRVLEVMVSRKHPVLLFAAHDAGLAPLRADPAWESLFARMDAVIAAQSS